MSTPSPKRPRRAPRSPSRQGVQVAWAFVAIVLFITVAGVILARTEGNLNKGYGVAIFVLAALIAGVSFWALTPAKDSQNVFVDGGIRLGGGAAVGLVFALSAWTVVNPDPQFVTSELPPDFKPNGLRAHAGSGLIEVDALVGNRRKLLYARFSPDAKKGEVTVTWFDPESDTGRQERRATIDRSGELEWLEQN